jgi:serine/threonine-protein kinase
MIFWQAILLTVIGGGLFLARRNLLMGRGDRTGAWRVALFVFVCKLVIWALGADHQPTMSEIGALFQQCAWALLVAALTWVVYLALEPYVRRIWPEMMISWNRVLRGRWRDPLVGRDILVGVASTLAGYLLVLPRFLALWLDRPLEHPVLWVELDGLAGIRQSIASVIDIPKSALVDGVALLFFLLLLRVLLRKPWAAAAALVLLMLFPSGANATNLFLMTPFDALYWAVIVFVLFRFGFLAAVVGSIGDYAWRAQVHTADPSAWYAGRSWVLLALLAALAIYGFRIATARPPVLRTPGA